MTIDTWASVRGVEKSGHEKIGREREKNREGKIEGEGERQKKS